MLPPAPHILGHLVNLVPAQPEHAQWILTLRKAAHKSPYLSPSVTTAVQQVQWMQEQNALGAHLYFIAQDKETGQAIGTVRIYDETQHPHSVSIGSWVMSDDTPTKKSLEALALAVQYIDYLGFNHCHFGVHTDNQSVLQFHRKMGATASSQKATGWILSNAPTVFLQRLCLRYQITLLHPIQLQAAA